MEPVFSKKINDKAKRWRIEAYLDRMYGYAFTLTNDRERARDLVQTSAVKALAAKKIPVDEPAYRAWLFKILRNAHYDEIRKDRDDVISLDHSEDCSGEDIWNKVGDVCVSTNEQVIIDELTVRSALQRLSHDHCEIIVLVDMIGYSYRESADLLDVPIGTIMSRISRARGVLLEELNREQRQPVKLRVVRLE